MVRAAATLSAVLACVLANGCSGNAEKPQYYVVSPPIAFAMLRDTPEITILDLRSREEFVDAGGHLHRALNIPLPELAERMSSVDIFDDTTFLVYCRGGDDCGARGMEILGQLGYDDAVLMAGGLPGWTHCGYGTVRTAAVENGPEARPGGGPEKRGGGAP